MLRLAELLGVLRMRRVVGVPLNDGSCFGVKDPRELRQESREEIKESKTRRWYDEPQVCPVCGEVPIDPDITAEIMDGACSPYGYIKCPKHFPYDVDDDVDGLDDVSD